MTPGQNAAILGSDSMRKTLGLILISLGFLGLYFFKENTPLIRLLYSSLGMIWLIKLAAVLWQVEDGARFRSGLGFFLFMSVWPGVSIQGFTERNAIPPSTGSRFLESWITFLVGLALLLLVSWLGEGSSTPLNYLALFSILCIVHLGLVEVIADGIRLLGFSPQSLFDRPFLATSLRDFWSLRWNRAFVDMNKIFILGPLRDRLPTSLLIFSIFVVSGFLHEMAISYPDGLSWGRPLLYFVIQGLGMQLEKRIRWNRIFVLAWILVPVPLLFTPDFTNLFLGGLGIHVFSLINQITIPILYKYGLVLGGAFHLLVLCASVQVPGKLGWKEEFKKLSSLNRKVFWTYGGYILSTIVFLSISSFVMSSQDLQRVTVSNFLWVLFISMFWWARVITDIFYMDHSDWPQGPLFTVGHICLSTLFLTMAILYTILCVVVWGALV